MAIYECKLSCEHLALKLGPASLFCASTGLRGVYLWPWGLSKCCHFTPHLFPCADPSQGGLGYPGIDWVYLGVFFSCEPLSLPLFSCPQIIT